MKIAIIGSGASGLTAIKCCRDAGFEPVCFEMEDELGGLWRFTENTESHSSVYRSTVINTSKEMMCYSDFPIPKEFPPFMHNTMIMKYFKMYADHFDLFKYIRFQTLVKSVRRSEDFEETGTWEMCYSKPNSLDETMETFDAVLICTGHHWKPNIPHFTGIDKFKGSKMHSHYYKDFRGYEGKKVVVIGIGNSGGDIAVELSYHAKEVYLSTRRGAWVLSRLFNKGIPVDQALSTRFASMFPRSFKEWVGEHTLNKKFDHANFGLLPKHGLLSQHPMVNDILPHRIITGSVVVKPDISYFTESSIVFEDGTEVEDLDAVIICTGYDISFPVLDESDVSVVDNQVNLYKYMFPVHHSKHTLAVIGLFQPLGAINPISELQVRWAVQVFKGEKKLPDRKDMEADIKKKKDDMSKRYYCSRRHTIQVDYVGFSNEIAELVGCRPNLLKLFFQDPPLALKCFFGPCTPPQYRLMGPNAWSGAKKAIEMVESNVIFPTKKRIVKQDEKPHSWFWFLIKMLLLPVVVAVIVSRMQ